MVNPVLIDILKRKIENGELKIEDIKNVEYKIEIEKQASL